MVSRERTLRTDALVLRHMEIGEADRLLTLFTEKQGKVRAIAKGVRKLHSRKAGHLEPFTHVHIQLARGRNLLILTQAETIEAFPELRENLESLGQASYVIELVDRFTFEGEENLPIFRLVIHTFHRLQAAPDPALVLRYFEMRLLDQLGFRPELQHCVNCERPIAAEDQYFSADHGGVLCPRCGANLPGARPISMHALRYLRHFQRSSFEQARIAEPSAAIHTELEILMHHYLTFLLERSLNTPAFMRKMRRELNQDPASSGSGSL
ncbi:MAG: DNA repair protein RecO [Anaerolineales bacterium]|jgi:DNA repair protein RecO (recombination protein O)